MRCGSLGGGLWRSGVLSTVKGGVKPPVRGGLCLCVWRERGRERERRDFFLRFVKKGAAANVSLRKRMEEEVHHDFCFFFCFFFGGERERGGCVKVQEQGAGVVNDLHPV